MNMSEPALPSQDRGTVPAQNWRNAKELLLTKAKTDPQPGDEFLLAQDDPDANTILYALLLALVHLQEILTFQRAVEYCGTIRMVTHLFFTIWDRAGGLSDTLTDVLVGIIKEGNSLLPKAIDNCIDLNERQKLKEYQGSCDFRWQQYKILKEQGREAVRAFVEAKANAVLANVQG